MKNVESKFIMILVGLVLVLTGSILLVGTISKLKYDGGFVGLLISIPIIAMGVFSFRRGIKN